MQLASNISVHNLACRPAGKLKVSIKGTWLKDAKIDLDALTEASFTTHKSGDGLEQAPDEDEQVCPVTLAQLWNHMPSLNFRNIRCAAPGM